MEFGCVYIRSIGLKLCGGRGTKKLHFENKFSVKHAHGTMNITKIMSTLILAVFGMSISTDSAATEKGRIDFSDYLWKNRPLLLFAYSPDASAYRTVMQELNSQSDQIVARDMVIIEIFETGLVRVNARPIPAENADKLRKRFEVAEGMLTAILIGKDGGLKRRQTGRIDLTDIFALIDTMPMRQREMRKKME